MTGSSDIGKLLHPSHGPRSAGGRGASVLAACGGGRDERPQMDLASAQVTSIGVNSYLWRATLETLAFMPLTQADSAGGVVVNRLVRQSHQSQ